ncbi:Uma2 family endonuclease [Alkalinema pantanalense CENA528]|uniref:Uma2 family endonuclease n=1 Tax=Alkalinema pantanalense TaxID=1620705 RepID=UPI003D6F3789
MVQVSDQAINQANPQPPERWFTLPGHHSWQAFQALATLLSANYSGVRVFYLDGVTELMSISPEHELIKSIVDALLVIFFCEQGINAVPMGSATLESEVRSVSVEPDLSYRLDGVVGPPELVVEVALSSGGREKLARYRRLGVPEVWFWQDDRLWLYGWNGEDYGALQESRLLAGLRVDLVEAGVRSGNLLEAVRIFKA